MVVRREMSFMKKNVAYKTKKLGCKKKMDNSWAPRKQKWGKVK